MARKSKRVYVPQLDKIFPSVAAAAKELHVNAANLSKVLTGSRRSAGGFSLIDASTYEKGGKVITPNRRSLRNKAVASGLTVGDPLYSKRMELADLLKDVNKNALEIRKSGLQYFAKGNNEALLISQYTGQTRDKLFKTDYKTLSKLSENELDKYLNAIARYKKYDTFTAKGADIVANLRGERLGVTVDLFARYKDILPYFFAVIDNIDKSKYDTDTVIEQAVDAMNDGADSATVIQALSDTNDMFNRIKLLSDLIYDDNSVLKNFTPIKGELKKLLNAYEYDPENDILKDAVDSIAEMIFNRITEDDNGDLLDIIKDDISDALVRM